MEASLATEHAGIRTNNFSFKVVNDITVDGSYMIMDKSCYIWLSCKDVPCNMGSLATAMPTRFSGIPVSTILMNSESDISSEMAQRLALRFKIQVFVSCNLPTSYEAYSHIIDKKVIELLKEFFWCIGRTDPQYILVTRRIASELSFRGQFHLLLLCFTMMTPIREPILPTRRLWNKVHTEEFGVDMRWVLECGHCRHSCDKIPLEGFIGEERSVFALKMNAKLVNCFLRSPQHLWAIERIVDNLGLEHLADFWLLLSDGTSEDLSAFPSILESAVPC